MDLVALCLSYALVLGASLFGAKARSARSRSIVRVAGGIAAAASVAAIIFGVTADRSSPVAAAVWGISGLPAAILTVLPLHPSVGIGRVLAARGRFSWSGGQSVAPAPLSEGYNYPVGGMLLFVAAFVQLCVAMSPIVGAFFLGLALLPSSFFVPAVACHSVVLGSVARLCHRSLFLPAA